MTTIELIDAKRAKKGLPPVLRKETLPFETNDAIMTLLNEMADISSAECYKFLRHIVENGTEEDMRKLKRVTGIDLNDVNVYEKLVIECYKNNLF